MPGPLRLGDETVQPSSAAQLLRVWLTPGLSWKSNIKETRAKVQVASRALAVSVGMLWGPRYEHARELYLRAIRPILTYRLVA